MNVLRWVVLVVFTGITLLTQAQVNAGRPGTGVTQRNFLTGNCDNWLQISDEYSACTIGDLDVTGHTITVEAQFNRIYINPLFKDSAIHGKGEIVSKHTDAYNANYILRADRAQLTTNRGHFVAAADCELPLFKTYHVALVYDGSVLKFYRNGFLLASTPCTGELVTNNLETLIGNFAFNPGEYNDALKGYLNEVRIWNVARSQEDIRLYMNTSLSNPTQQHGLLAYYIFDNLKNKQGDSRWDGHLLSNAHINQSNPTCNSFVADSCETTVTPVIVTAGFLSPDTICVNTPIHFTNTSAGATNSYWSFCTPDLNATTPYAENLGTLGGALSSPSFIDLVKDGNNYYGFLINHKPGNLVRLNYGNSLLNTPTTTNLGNFNNILSGQSGGGLQVVKSNNNWYAIIVAGGTTNNEESKIITVDFGADITNSSPIATSWGNIGNLASPTDLSVIFEEGEWYGFTINSASSTVTRFRFGSDFNNSPTGENLGNFSGMLSYPTGLTPINDNGEWHLFITNRNNNSLTRLDFGESFLNNPQGVNLGTISNTLNKPRDIFIENACSGAVGFVVNEGSNDLVKLDFKSSITNQPTGFSFGNSGGLNDPNSLSEIFRMGNDMYIFITNAFDNTLTRLRFTGCNSASPSGYEGDNPPAVTYNTPGIYNISLSVDENLPTQTAYCRQVTVLDKPLHQPIKDTSFCSSSSLRLSRSYPNVTFLWNTGATGSSITVTKPGTYWVQFNKGYDCTSTDTFVVHENNKLVLDLGRDTAVCSDMKLTLDAGNPGNTYLWQDGSTKEIYNVSKSGTYSVRVTNAGNCFVTDTVLVRVIDVPVIHPTRDMALCEGDSVLLQTNPSASNYLFKWENTSGLNDYQSDDPLAFPTKTTIYHVTVSNDICSISDSISVSVSEKPFLQTISDTTICKGGSLVLQTMVNNAGSVQWTPAIDLTNSDVASPTASPQTTTSYAIAATNGSCTVMDSLTVYVDEIDLKISNDTTVCGETQVQLQASGGDIFHWLPAAGLSDPTIANPIANVKGSLLYSVTAEDAKGCKATDTVIINYLPRPTFDISRSAATICSGDTISVKASGGDSYEWSPSSAIITQPDGLVQLMPTETTTYSVQIQNSQCSASDEKSVVVSVLPTPVASIVSSNSIDCSADSTVLTASGGTAYTWSPQTGLSNPFSSTTIARPDANIMYSVRVGNEFGCYTTDTISLNVSHGSNNTFSVPSAFTPNGDGRNDCFGVKHWTYIRELDFSIFDRWGVRVFHTKDVSQCWNGMFKGEMEPNGTYIYLIHAKTDCGTVDKKGALVLIR